MLQPRVRRTALALSLTAAFVALPLAEAGAAPRSKVERPARKVEVSKTLDTVGGAVRSLVRSFWERAGISIDENGLRKTQESSEIGPPRPSSDS
jgi:hypothetical protein